MPAIPSYPLIFALLATGVAFPAWADSPATDSGRAFDQWIETRRMIDAEESRWREGKSFLQQSTEAMEAELKMLDEEIASHAETAVAGDERHDEMTAERKALRESATKAEMGLIHLEDEVRRIAPLLPAILAAHTGSAIERMGSEAEMTLPQRMQNVLAVLNELHGFNREITLAREVRDRADGRGTEVQTLYVGLGQAYFVNNDGTFAGYGQPAENGWEWTTDNTLARPVAQAIAIYEKDSPAEFISLPVKIQ